MLTRIITAAVALAAFIPVLIYSDTIAFPIAMAFLAAIAVVEMLKCVGCKSKAVFVTAFVTAGGMPVCARLLESRASALYLLCGAMFILLMEIFTLSVFSHGKFDITDACTCFAMSVYIVASFTCIVLLRDSKFGSTLYLTAFLGPWISDSAAYFCGRALGRHKLIPDVSPKKTVEGSVGGIFFTGVAFLIYGVFSMMDGKASPVACIILFAVGALVSMLSQIGDLIASLLKRKYGIKDYGKLFPGHGGVMDRFDSVLITAPLLFAVGELFANISIF